MDAVRGTPEEAALDAVSTGGHRPTVMSLFPLLHPIAEELLAPVVDLRIASQPTAAALIAEGSGAVGLIGRAPAEVGADVFDALPGLAVVFGTGSGADWCDLAAATERGIPVVNNPGVAPSAVAEYTVVAVVTALRRLPEAEKHLRAGGSWEPRDRHRGREAAGRTLGIIGMGAIGRDVARRARAGFDMRVVGFDPYRDDRTFGDDGVERVSLGDLLARSDAVTLHVPLTEETRGLIGAPELAMMKPGAVLVNTARGAVINGDALCKAIASGHLGGCVVDVFDPEPPLSDSELFGLDNVAVTPHIAGMTDEAMLRLSRAVATNVITVLEGGRPPSILNPSAWPPRKLPAAMLPATMRPGGRVDRIGKAG